jgi:hypothetical protein
MGEPGGHDRRPADELAQLAQFEGRFEILLLMLVKEIKGLAGVLGANRRVVPTIPIFF